MNKLLQDQDVFLKTIERTLEQHHLSHAVLLKGGTLDTQKEAALFLAQSIVCENDTLACGTCNECRRIYEGEYVDYIFIDGSKETIKKQEIEQLQSQFSYSALEQAGVKIYIIHAIENATIESLNSLLKFLEEPDGETYAIFTTNNIDKVLPTVLSRCQMMVLKNESIAKKVSKLRNLGVDEDDAYILSTIIDDIDKVRDEISSERYQVIKKTAYRVLEKISEKQTGHLIAQLELLKNYHEVLDVQLFLRILYFVFKSSKFDEQHYFACIQETVNKLNRIKDVEQKMMLVLDFESKLLNTNMNVSLLVDQLLYQMNRGEANEYLWGQI